MHHVFRDVLEFHQVLKPDYIGAKPEIPDGEILDDCLDLIAEEYSELLAALACGTIAEVAKEIAELIYVTIALAISCGIDLVPVWEAVQEANLKKVGGERVNGKVLKPKGWQPPDIESILARQTSHRKAPFSVADCN